jgi:dihydroxy-acid dehydratase
LYAAGYKREDFNKPIITIAVPHTNTGPCNNHFRLLGDILLRHIEAKGGKGVLVGGPVVLDGMIMGGEGMRYSLPSRDLLADTVEMMHETYRADAMITVGGCDKTQPGVLMPILRGNSIGLTMYGGTILPGKADGLIPKWEALSQTSDLNNGAGA